MGKSSLLEKIAGMDFFPRGENVTTRLGFRLRLHHCTPKEMDEFPDDLASHRARYLHDLSSDAESLPPSCTTQPRLQTERTCAASSSGFSTMRSWYILSHCLPVT